MPLARRAKRAGLNFLTFREAHFEEHPRRAVDSLFRRFAVEVLVVGLRLVAGMVDDAVPMIRRRIERIERIELQWTTAGIDDVVIRPSRDDYREARADHRAHARWNDRWLRPNGWCRTGQRPGLQRFCSCCFRR